MRIGFTGTQTGMTLAQYTAFANLIGRTDGEFHHGLCLGADADAHKCVWEKQQHKIIGHPPIKTGKRMWINPNEFHILHPPKDYLDRNRDIVDAVELMLATPKEWLNQTRSGTWYTIRYARRTNKRTLIIWPDGSVHDTAKEKK